MQPRTPSFRLSALPWCGFLVCLAALGTGCKPAPPQQGQTAPAQQVPSTPGTVANQPAMLSPDQLDSLVAPIALYPDPLLAQTLAASTYPLEIIQLQQWMSRNPNLKDKALADAVVNQPWDASVQALAAYPDVVTRLGDDIGWTTDLGNAFLGQQNDVMDACQRMRKRAQAKGALKTTEQQVVETRVVEQKTVILVQPANPQVIYVPSYSPMVVYPPPVYPYPPIYYPPPPPPGAAFVSFAAGVMIGAAFWGGSWGHCGWGHNDVTINVDNNFNRNNINTGNINTGNINRGNSNWSHNASHRGGAPYADKTTASKYGGTARGDSLSSRQANAQKQQARSGASAGQQQARGGASSGGSRGASPSTSNRSTGSSSRGASPSTANRSAGGAGPSTANRSAGGASASPVSAGGGGFGGGSGGFNGSSARASSSRGASSFGGGGRSGGGGRKR
jgi:hypothetical protein